MGAEDFQEVKVLVPVERVAEFYEMAGRWLAGRADDGTTGVELEPWSADDLALAEIVWGRMTKRARDLFSALMAHPGEPVSSKQLEADLDLASGAYGVAGVLSYPGRYCYAQGRKFPVMWEAGQSGGFGQYWMTPEVAALFQRARDGK
jgi:hypothetical protein